MGKRPFLLLFIFFLCFSCLIRPKQAPIEQLGFLEEYGIVQGIISTISEKENFQELSIKNGHFLSKDSKKKCPIKKILVYLKKEKQQKELHIGNQVQVTGSILLFQKPTNLGQFNEYDYYKGKNYDCKMYAEFITIHGKKQSKLGEWLRRLKLNWQKIVEEQLPNAQAGIIEAMVLGEKSNLDSEIKELYQKNGIGHIMAISGLHISFWGMGVYRLLKQMGMKEQNAIILSICIIFLYGMMTGFSVSSVRAIIMLTIALLARILGRTYDMLSAMSVSGVITMIACPLQVKNSGFLLSYGAIIGIGCCYPILKKTINSKSKLIDGFLVTLSIQMVLLPITAWFYYEIPLYGSFLNLLVLPFMSLLLTSSILGVFCTYIHPIIGKFLFGTVHMILMYYEILCRTIIKLPFNSIVIGKPLVIQVILYVILVLLILYLLYKKEDVKWMLLIPISFLAFYTVPIHQLEVTVLDVGQGDSIFFQTGKMSYLMDGGSSDIKKVGTYRILPFLKAKGISSLDCIIVSHTDNDHINGLVELLEQTKQNQFKVKYLMLPRISNPDKSYKRMEDLARTGNVNILYIEKGMEWEKEKLRINCLHPSKTFLLEDKNECSMILSLQYGALRILLTGDVEQEGEKEIVPYLRNHEILKVAHHGSKSSSTEEFLEKVNPRFAFISSGKNNSYGHPHKEVIDRMKKRKVKIYNTSETGAISLKSNGKSITIKKFISE